MSVSTKRKRQIWPHSELDGFGFFDMDRWGKEAKAGAHLYSVTEPTAADLRTQERSRERRERRAIEQKMKRVK